MTAIYWTWCFPQTLLGWLWWVTLNVVKTIPYPYKLGATVVIHKGKHSVSLGKYLICASDNENVVKHEFGHCKQSLILGPLYLIVVGLPSLTWNILKRMGLFKSTDYYAFYTEAWADSLGGVER